MTKYRKLRSANTVEWFQFVNNNTDRDELNSEYINPFLSAL